MKKKLYTLICAGLIMVASAMSSYAAEIEGIDGINIEKADYDISRVVDEDTSEGIAKGIEPRGSIIDTAMTSISNLGKGDIGIFIQTLAHVECDKIKNIAVLQREEGGKWVEVSRYTYDASKEDFPTEDLSGMTNDFTVKNQKTGYDKDKGCNDHRIRRLIPNGDSVTKSIFVTRNSMKKAII